MACRSDPGNKLSNTAGLNKSKRSIGDAIDRNPGVRIECDAFRYAAAADAFAGHVKVCQKVGSGEIGE
jgi:hypothetical protein